MDFRNKQTKLNLVHHPHVPERQGRSDEEQECVSSLVTATGPQPKEMIQIPKPKDE
jgi:hypothetical protein